MNNIFITNIGDLLDIQRVSYYKFLTEGLNSVLEPLSKKEFSLTKPLTKLVKKKEKKKKIERYLDYNIYFAPKNIKLSFPEDEFTEIDNENKTYSIHAYLPVFYSITEKNDDYKKTHKKKKRKNNKIISKIINFQIKKVDKKKKIYNSIF